MKISTGTQQGEKAITRRAVLAALIVAPLVALTAPNVIAQRRRRGAVRQRLLHQRRVRRRALRRFRQQDLQTQEEARAAVRRGDIRPLRDVFRVVRQHAAGEVLDVELLRQPEGWVYFLRILTVRDRVRDVWLDARTLQVLNVR